MNPHVIVCDLGCVRAFRINPSGPDPEVHRHLAELPVDSSGLRRRPLRQIVTDRAGGFPGGGPAGQRTGMPHGEAHHLEDELDADAVARLADRIVEVLGIEGFPPWRLVAPAGLEALLRECLPPTATGTLTGSECGDLTGLPVARLERLLL